MEEAEKSPMKSQLLPTNSLCVVVCRGTELALRGSVVKHSSITGALPDPQDMCQLWMLCNSSEGYYEVVNAVSDYCLDDHGGEFKLGRPKWSSNQLVVLQKSNIQEYYEYYWIKLGDQDLVATLTTNLACKPFEADNSNQLFRFEPVGDKNTIINDTVIIENPACGKVLDVPEGSMEKGAKIIQWKRNNRFNQRWQIVKYGTGFQIRSLKSGLNLDICYESKKPGAKIIQWDVTAASNQLWNFEPKPDGLYAIRSVLVPDLMLGVVDNSN